MRHIFLLVMAIVPACIFAQGEPGSGQHSLGVAAELSIPVGNFSDVAGIGYGGLAKYQLGVDRRTAVTVSLGYIVWSAKDLALGSVQAHAFESLVGGKVYFGAGFFGSLDALFYALTYTQTDKLTGYEGTTWKFMLPIGIGYQMNGFEIAARYSLLRVNATSLSFTLGYNWIM